MNSNQIKSGFERAPHRSLLRATGVKREDFGKPFIGVCNSFCEIVPGHVHLDKVSALVKKAIRAAGGMPFEFNTIAVCDGIAMGHAGMKYSLPSRELIADCVETMVRAHAFDALICIPTATKSCPACSWAPFGSTSPRLWSAADPWPPAGPPTANLST